MSNFLIYSILVISYIIPFTKNFFPFIKFLDDIFLVIAILHLLFSRGLPTRLRLFDFFIVFFILLSIFSMALNGSPISNLFIHFKYFLFPLAFYYLIISCNSLNIRRLKTLISIIILIQIPIIIYQIIRQFAVTGYMHPDTASGTFSSTNVLSYVFLPFIFYQCSVLLRDSSMRFSELIKTSVILSIFIIGYGLFAILVFPYLFLLYNFKPISRRILSKSINRSFMIIFTITSLSLIIGFLANITYGSGLTKKFHSFFDLYTFDYLYDRVTRSEFSVSEGSARNLWYGITLEKLNQNAYSPFIGMGPGVYASLTGFTLMPPQTLEIYNILNQDAFGVDKGVDSQIIPIWGELGHVGLLLFIIFLTYCIFRYHKLSKLIIDHNGKIIALTASASALYMLLGFYVNHFWEIQNLAITIFLFFGVADRIRLNEIARRAKLQTR